MKWLSLLMPGLVSTIAYFVIEDEPTAEPLKVALVVLALGALVASLLLLSIYESEAKGVRAKKDAN